MTNNGLNHVAAILRVLTSDMPQRELDATMLSLWELGDKTDGERWAVNAVARIIGAKSPVEGVSHD